MLSKNSPIQSFVDQQGFVLLDGGLATELENRGFNLDSPMWSAHLLYSNPDAIRDVHMSYLEAGANCIVSASYQASIKGFLEHGFTLQQAGSLLIKSVELACEARDEYVAELDHKTSTPIIAASIGPYGAYLANGAEYRGEYGISKKQLLEFHKTRWEILAESDADLLACETIPSLDEAEVLAELLQDSDDVYAWISFSCRDGVHISDGTPVRECARLFAANEKVIAVGVNCTKPRYIVSLIGEIGAIAQRTPIIVYPNSGEIYSDSTRSWSGCSDSAAFGEFAQTWYTAGAKLIGGCCRTGPGHIKSIRSALLNACIADD